MYSLADVEMTSIDVYVWSISKSFPCFNNAMEFRPLFIIIIRMFIILIIIINKLIILLLAINVKIMLMNLTCLASELRLFVEYKTK